MMRVIICLWFVAMSCHASTSFEINPKKTIQTHISNRDFNRISIQDDRITQLFFDKTDFLVEMDEVNGQIFVKPIRKTSINPLSFSMTTEKGKTQDWLFSFVNCKSRTLILYEREPEVVRSSACQEQAVVLLNQLMSEDSLKGMVKRTKLLSVAKGWQLKRLKQLKKGHLIGYVLTLKNISGEKQGTTANVLWGDSVLALSIARAKLEAGESTSVFVVTDARGLK